MVRMTLRVHIVLGALIALLITASVAVAATPTATHGTGPAAAAKARRCGTVAAYSGGAADPSQVQVVKSKGLSCRKARAIMSRCVAQKRVPGWRAGPSNATSTLSSKGRRISYRMVSGPAPSCAHGLTLARQTGQFGPFEQPISFPSKWPAPFTLVYQWTTPVTTYSATIPINDISDVTLVGFGHNRDGQMRSFWFQYGTTRDLGSETEKQNPPTTTTDAPITFTARLLHLKAKMRFYWRSVANIDQPDGSVKTVYGALGSFVTKPYPTIKDPSRPCDSMPSQTTPELFQLTESLAISCSPEYRFTNSACFPFCVNTYSGTLRCNKDFPRNLNSGEWSFTIPEIAYRVNVNDLVNYWRSNNSNRFITTPFTNKNSPGGEVGPVPGFHDWNVGQYAYPGESTATNVRFWINCTEKWGGVIDASALAQGEGNDTASTVPPGTPTDFKAVKNADGGYDATWQAPSSTSASGIAGYYLTVIGWAPGQPKAFADDVFTPVDFTGLSGNVSAAHIGILKQAAPSNYELTLAVGAVSREGSVSTPAVIPIAR
jgi:hypothetical protein